MTAMITVEKWTLHNVKKQTKKQYATSQMFGATRHDGGDCFNK